MKDSAPIWMAIAFFGLPGVDACCAELVVAVVAARPATVERKKSLRSIFPPWASCFRGFPRIAIRKTLMSTGRNLRRSGKSRTQARHRALAADADGAGK